MTRRPAWPAWAGRHRQRSHIEVTAELGTAEQTAIIETLIRDGVPVRAFGPVPVNLEDVFVTLTGEGFGVSG